MKLKRARLLVFCAQGFELEAARELATFVPSNPDVSPRLRSGFVLTADEVDLSQFPPVDQLVFTRQLFVAITHPLELPDANRAQFFASHFASAFADPQKRLFSSLDIITPESDATKPLSRFCKSLTPPSLAQLQKQGFKRHENGSQLVVLLLSGSEAVLGFTHPELSSRWLHGFPRLQFPAQAPSRSTLKLEEALIRFLPEDNPERFFRANKKAVDLGASPGGWTYQLVRRGLKVEAVDHGKIDQRLLQSGQVIWKKENGLKYLPPHAVDWLVCDMIETPQKILPVLDKWIAQHKFKFAIVTLKIPMKNKWAVVENSLEHLKHLKKKLGIYLDVQCKHLYHNRDEVTLFIRLVQEL